jgi:glycosyltransferase involved in cell wall biosynthesis
MRICQVIPSLSPSAGGIPVTLVGLARSLGSLDCDQRIVTTGQSPLEIEPRRSDGAALPVVRLANFGPRQYGLTLAVGRLGDTVGWSEVVSVHGIWTMLGTAAMVAARRRKIPYFVHAHGMLDPRALSRSALKKRLIGSATIFPLIRRAAGIVYGCEQERRDAEAATKGLPPGVVVPYTVDPPAIAVTAEDIDAFRRKSGLQDGIRLLFLGRLDAKKRPDLAIEAVAALASQGSNVRLVIVGDGEPGYVEGLRTLAKASGAADRVVFLGPLFGNDKWIAYASCDVYVLPSEQESLAITMLEAAASGLPIVTTPYVAGWEEVAGLGKVRIVDTSVASVTAGLVTLLASLPQDQRAAQAGAQAVRDSYSSSRSAGLLAAAYRSAVV